MPKKKPTSINRWKGNSYAVKHGAYAFLRSGLIQGCDKCPVAGECQEHDVAHKQCPPLVRLEGELSAEIMALPHIEPQDALLVEELVRDRLFIALVDRWLGKAGLFKPGLDEGNLVGQGILKQRWVAANSMSRLAEQLGLSPQARARLKLSGKGAFDLARAIREIEDEPCK